MILGILSDTHNNQRNLQAALALFKKRGVSTLLHCGDFTGVEVAAALAEFQVIGVFGNGDVASGEIRRVLLEQNPGNYAGLVYTGKLDGVRIAATHGHLPGRLEELLRSGEYDYVFKGHSHMHQDEKFGYTRLINPGALGGLHREERRVCLLDLQTGKVEFVIIAT